MLLDVMFLCHLVALLLVEDCGGTTNSDLGAVSPMSRYVRELKPRWIKEWEYVESCALFPECYAEKRGS